MAQALTVVCERLPQAQALLQELHGASGRARIVGITGAPGVGKSTLTAALVRTWRGQGHTVGVVAVDPTSPFTGGALLGDRVRMAEVALDEGVFIRSLATRGARGGLAEATADAVQVLDAAGFGRIAVETIGTGQAEVDIVATAHSCVVVLVPGMGDEVQAFKAGILEIADLFVINKADRDGADRLQGQLQAMLELSPPHHGYLPPILRTVATTGEGVEEVVAALDAHWDHLRRSGKHRDKEVLRARTQVEALLTAEVLAAYRDGPLAQALAQTVEAVAQRTLDPHTAVARLRQRAGK